MIDEETLRDWRTNYDLHREPHDLAEFWSAYTPTGAVLALKAAVEEIERLRAALVESAGEVDRPGHIEAQTDVVEEQIKEIDRALMAVREASRDAPTLEEKLSWQKKQRELEGKRSTLRRELFRLMDMRSE